MIYKSCERISEAYNSWNHYIETATKKAICLTTCCLPYRVHGFVTEKFLNEMQMLTHLFFSTGWVQATLANPFLPRCARYSISICGIAITLAPFFSYTKKHFQKLNTISPTKKVIAVTAFFSFGAAAVTGSYNLKAFVQPISTQGISIMSLLSFGALSAQISTHITLLPKEPLGKEKDLMRENVDDILDFDASTDVENEAKRASYNLELEIQDLETKIKKIDQFIEENPELAQLCNEALKTHRSVYSSSKRTNTEHLDSNNIHHKRALLGLRKIELESQLEERMIFLQRNPEVLACAQRILNQQPSSHQRTEETYLLIEG